MMHIFLDVRTARGRFACAWDDSSGDEHYAPTVYELCRKLRESGYSRALVLSDRRGSSSAVLIGELDFSDESRFGLELDVYLRS